MATKPASTKSTKSTKPATAAKSNPRRGLDSTKSTKPAPAAKSTPAVTSAVADSVIVATYNLGQTLAAVDSSATRSILDSQWTALDSYVAGLATYAAGFAKVWQSLIAAAGVKYNAAAIVTAWETKGGRLYLTPADRKSMPTRSTLERALTIGNMHTAARAKAFRASGNAPTIKDYIPYLTKVSGAARDGGNTKIDWTKSAAAAAEHAKETGVTIAKSEALKITRKPVARQTTPTTTAVDTAVTPWGAMSAMSDKELAAVETVADVEIPAELLPAFVRQMIAQVILAERAAAAAKPTVKVTVRATK